MRRIRFAFVAASLILTGCGSLNGCGVLTGQETVAEQAPEAALTAKKSLTVAHLALEQVGETLIELAKPGGLLKGESAATAKQWYDRADDALKSADALELAANTQGVMSAIKIAEDALFQANEIVKSVKK